MNMHVLVPAYLADEFIQTLRVELLSDGADARLSRLALQQTLVKILGVGVGKGDGQTGEKGL